MKERTQADIELMETALDLERDDVESERCPHCGKPFEEFGDLGCEYCDRRHPGFGVAP